MQQRPEGEEDYQDSFADSATMPEHPPSTAGAPQKNETKKTKQAPDRVSYFSELTEKGKFGAVCAKVLGVSDHLTSRSGWKYRRMSVEDPSMNAEILISEDKFGEWKFRVGDYVACAVKSAGVDATGRLSVYYDDFIGPLDAAKILYELSSEANEKKTSSRSGERMKPAETVYQISAREARSLLELIRLWISEGKPQHYTKWCQMHQIVATNLFYMGLVKRTGSMSGHYYPTEVALEFFEGKKKLPKKKVFTRGKDGRHVLASDEGEERSFSDYLSDYGDRNSALREYRDALQAYKEKKLGQGSNQ